MRGSLQLHPLVLRVPLQVGPGQVLVAGGVLSSNAQDRHALLSGLGCEAVPGVLQLHLGEGRGWRKGEAA